MSAPQSPNELERRSMRLLARAEARDKAFVEAEQRIGAVSGEASSLDGSVRATVDPWGTLTALRLDDRTARLPRASLSDVIVEVVRQAAEKARTEVRSVHKGLEDAGFTKRLPLDALGPAPAAEPDVPRRRATGGDEPSAVFDEQNW
ncbi:YbaB/EbfC DNA-binding family protein [Herbihabitans rhizosphaerae]|uniref:YbaB/EbfC DNA-binding family protein n=1 Tax=Herbihabitans rhizosphaerae TaxID=1872711 RepID=A0A4Q7L6H3_9PSEU|nr:YbaB/EbfC family nucleoid-associated protein [Herbihabitans rhizosphaerae]RZS44191.1 YbaB/EbfC DNA-binding family protein [Herbihabitans rhizosphaerae]